MWFCVGLAALNLIGALVYFPAHPPHPPSTSAIDMRALETQFKLKDLWTTTRTAMSSRNFVVLMLVYGLAGGMYSGWGSAFSVNVGQIGYSQDTAGLIATVAGVTGNLVGIPLGWYIDRKRHHYWVLLGFTTVGGLAAAYFAVLVDGGLPAAMMRGSYGQVFALSLLIAIGMGSTACVFFEAVLEVTHPLPQGTILMIITMVYNLGGFIILLIPATDTSLFNYFFAGGVLALCFTLAVGFKPEAKRFEIDAGLAEVCEPVEEVEEGEAENVGLLKA